MSRRRRSESGPTPRRFEVASCSASLFCIQKYVWKVEFSPLSFRSPGPAGAHGPVWPGFFLSPFLYFPRAPIGRNFPLRPKSGQETPCPLTVFPLFDVPFTRPQCFSGRCRAAGTHLESRGLPCMQGWFSPVRCTGQRHAAARAAMPQESPPRDVAASDARGFRRRAGRRRESGGHRPYRWIEDAFGAVRTWFPTPERLPTF
jgi:hypothetical protein